MNYAQNAEEKRETALFRVLSDLDDDLILEAETEKKVLRPYGRLKRLAGLAACFAFVLAALLWKDNNKPVMTYTDVLTPIPIDLLFVKDDSKSVDRNGEIIQNKDFSRMSAEALEEYFNDLSDYQKKAVSASQKVMGYAEVKSAGAETAPVYRDEYAGCYIFGDKLVITLTDMDKEILSGYKALAPNDEELLIFEQAKYSLNEKLNCMDRLQRSFRERGIIWYEMGPAEIEDCVFVGLPEASLKDAITFIRENGLDDMVKLFIGSPVVTE